MHCRVLIFGAILMNLKLRTSVKLHKAFHVFTSWALYQRDNRGQICASDDSQCFNVAHASCQWRSVPSHKTKQKKSNIWVISPPCHPWILISVHVSVNDRTNNIWSNHQRSQLMRRRRFMTGAGLDISAACFSFHLRNMSFLCQIVFRSPCSSFCIRNRCGWHLNLVERWW